MKVSLQMKTQTGGCATYTTYTVALKDLDNLALLRMWRLRFVSVASSRWARVSSICLINFMSFERLNSNVSLSIV